MTDTYTLDTKMCTKCLEVKSVDRFTADKKWCRDCVRAYNRQYRETNRGRLNEYDRLRYELDPSRKEVAHRWARLNPDARKAYQKKYYRENKETIYVVNATWRKANRERVYRYSREWIARNPEKRREIARKWAQENPDAVHAGKHRRRAREANAHHEPYSRTEIFARWSGKCCYCSADAEHLDHVTPISRQGADAEWNLVPACATCNTSKGAKSLAEWAMTFGPDHD